jgi:hypothetical protein
VAEITATDDSPPQPDQPVAEPGRPIAGMLLAGRYRLHRPVANGPACTVWIADDAILARRVAVKVLNDEVSLDDERRAQFLERARLTARIEHPGIATTFDSGTTPCVFAVGELVEGARLVGFAASEAPLALPRAVAIAMQLAGALDTVVHHGIEHDGFDLDDVLISAGDVPTITGLRCAGPDESPSASHRAAVATVGAALYALVCGRPPGGSALPPRQVRADVTRELDEITTRALDAGFESVAELRVALGRLQLPDDRVRPPAPVTRSNLPRSRRDVGLIAGVLTVAVVSVLIGVLFGSESGRRVIDQVIPGGEQEADRTTASGAVEPEVLDASVPATSAIPPSSAVERAPGSAPGIIVRPVTVRDFDPMGDGSEKPDQVALVIDDDPTTSWRSELYDTAGLGGLKDGVGLVVTIPSDVTATALRISGTGTGWSALVHVTSGGPAPTTYAGWGEPVARVTAATASETTIELGAPTTGGSVLVWFTTLHESADPGKFTITVSEIVLFSAVS